MAAGKRRHAKSLPPSALRELEAVAARLSIPVRYEKGDMRGGLCRLRGQPHLIVNEDLTDEEKADVLAEGLAQVDFEAVYVPPRVRDLLEQARRQLT